MPTDVPVYEKVPPEEFDWPCGLRVAHGPHVERGVVLHSSQPDGGGIPVSIECAGVRAHPATVAGTTWRLITKET